MVSCIQYVYYNEYGPVAKVTALVNQSISRIYAKELITKEILGNYTEDNHLPYTAELERAAIRNTQDVIIGDLQLDMDYPYKEIDDFHILDFHKLKNWNIQ